MQSADRISTKFKVIASDLAFPEGPIAMPDGSFLLVEIAAGRVTRISQEGKVSQVAHLGGSPNGLAIGPDGHCYVCNSGGFTFHNHPGYGLAGGMQPPDYSGGRIERINLSTGKSELLYDRCGDRMLKGPNDLVFDRHGGFWFTDSGKSRPTERDHGGIYYAKTDGSMISSVVFPNVQPQPNGIGLSPDESRLYMAETSTGRVWRFDITGPGEIRREPFPSPNGGTLLAGLPGFQLLDSLAVEANGNVCVATMMNGGITVIEPDGNILEHVPLPDLLVTNICFGGEGLKTAYICMSATGKLVAVDWPRPGLALNFLNK